MCNNLHANEYPYSILYFFEISLQLFIWFRLLIFHLEICGSKEALVSFDCFSCENIDCNFDHFCYNYLTMMKLIHWNLEVRLLSFNYSFQPKVIEIFPQYEAHFSIFTTFLLSSFALYFSHSFCWQDFSISFELLKFGLKWKC